jgi:hypothetical protein
MISETWKPKHKRRDPYQTPEQWFVSSGAASALLGLFMADMQARGIIRAEAVGGRFTTATSPLAERDRLTEWETGYGDPELEREDV